MRYLICDDRRQDRQRIEACLRSINSEVEVEVISTSTVSEAQNLLAGNEQFDLVIVDIAFPKGTGFDLMRALDRRGKPKFVVATNWPNSHNRNACQLLGARAVVHKDLMRQELGAIVSDLFETDKLEPELTDAMQDIMVRVRDIPSREGAKILSRLAQHWKIPLSDIGDRETDHELKVALDPDPSTIAVLNKTIDCFQAACEWLDAILPTDLTNRGKIQAQYTEPLTKQFGHVLGAVLVRQVQGVVIQDRKQKSPPKVDLFTDQAKFSKDILNISSSKGTISLAGIKISGKLEIPVAKDTDLTELAGFERALGGVLCREGRDRFGITLILKIVQS